MVYLIDSNVIIHFLLGDNAEQLNMSTDIFKKIENGEYEVQLLEVVLMETFLTLTKLYKLPKSTVISDLKKIISLRGVMGDKALLIDTLNLVESQEINFVDALIWSQSRLHGYGKVSFDKEIL